MKRRHKESHKIEGVRERFTRKTQSNEKENMSKEGRNEE